MIFTAGIFCNRKESTLPIPHFSIWDHLVVYSLTFTIFLFDDIFIPIPHLYKQRSSVPLLKAEQTLCGFPWSRTSKFCHRWWSRSTGQWANPGRQPLGPSSPDRPAMNTQSWPLPRGLPSTTSCGNTAALRVVVCWVIQWVFHCRLIEDQCSQTLR